MALNNPGGALGGIRAGLAKTEANPWPRGFRV